MRIARPAVRVAAIAATLVLCRIAPGAAGAAGPVLPIPLAPGRPIEAELGGNEEGVYETSLKKGEFLRVDVEQRGVDVVVAVRDPRGRLLVEHDTLTGAYGTETVRVIAAASGAHRVTLRVLDPAAIRGRCVIRVSDPRAARPDDARGIAAQSAALEGARLRNEGGPASLSRAGRALERALLLWRSLGDREEEALTLYELASVARQRGENQLALERYTRAVPVARAAGDRQLEARLHDGVGLTRLFLGDPAGAADVLPKSMALAQSIGDEQTANEARNTLGWAETLLGHYDRAIEIYRVAIAEARKRGERAAEAWPTNGLAFAYLRIGERKKALAIYERALTLWRSIGDRRGEVLALEDIGFLHWSAGDSARALSLYEQALPIARALGDGRGEALALNNIGLANESLGRHEVATRRLGEALAIWRRMADQPGEVQTLHNLGRVEAALGRSQAALALWNEELALARRSRDGAGEAKALTEIARQETVLDRLDDARSHAEEAVSILEAQRRGLRERALRSTFLSTQQDAFAVLTGALLRLHERRPDERLSETAFAVSERGRARSFLESLEAARSGSGSPAPSAGLPATAGLVRERLRPDCALVSFWFESDRVIAFLATRRTFEVVTLSGSPGELSERVRVFQDLVARGSTASAERVGQRLYREAALPWLRRLPPGIRRLVLVPDRALHSLPFDVLRPPGGRRIIEDFVVSYTPSASVFAALAALPPKGGAVADVLAVSEGAPAPRRRAAAVVAFDGERFDTPPLAHAAQEAAEAARWGGAGSRVLAGEEFAEERRKGLDLGRFRVLHFATHGLLSRVSPERSALLLSPSPGATVLLEAREIYGWRLASDLVVLSACRSGQGKELPGEGVEGLARAFLQAGARTVLASLWNVDDARGAELMATFYRRLAEGASKADALREARIELVARHAVVNERVWAPLILIGEPDGRIPLRRPSGWRRLVGMFLPPGS